MQNLQKLTILLLFLINSSSSKYIQGVISTSNNWAFLARFCFLSEKGRFEYNLEFNEEQGMPNILLYYDTDDQWPSVYKSDKNCYEREAVLHLDQLQVVNLTVDHPYFQLISGCNYQTSVPTSQVPKYTLNLPTRPRKRNKTEKTTPLTTTTAATSTISLSSSTFESSSLSDSSTEFVENVTTTLEPAVVVQKRSLPQRYPFYQRRGHRTITCRKTSTFLSARERWWFIAVSNCGGRKGIHIKYKILMTNGEPGDYWHEHFSADEFYVLPVLMAFTIAYTFLLLGIVVCSMELKSRQLLHTTYKIFVCSVLLQFFGIVINSGVFLRYSTNGIGPNSRLRRFGSVLMGASETLYLMLLLLLAKGFTITRGRLPLSASVKLTVFMCLYVVTYISIFIYEANVFDPGEVLYLYKSPAGYSLITLRVIAWFMFIYSTVFTLKHYPEKSNFYYPFNICGTLWFIAGPAFILSANTYIDKWVRESVVCAVLQFITFGGHLTFLILTMPSVANKNFPYHVRTSQIGIMEVTGANGASSIEQFSHHVYQPSEQPALIVPLSRRTEEIYEGMYAHDMQNTIRRESLLDPAQIQQNNQTMENVANWSLAKNISAIEIPNFETTRRNSYASSIGSRAYSELEAHFSRRESINNSTINNDYVRDVPVELFTVSRMTPSSEIEVNTVSNNKNSVKKPSPSPSAGDRNPSSENTHTT